MMELALRCLEIYRPVTALKSANQSEWALQGRCAPRFFRAVHALAVDRPGAQRGLAAFQLPGNEVERVMDTLQRAAQSHSMR